MTQTFIGYKPGVGPVLKCLKYDTDDPLTLANTAFDRFFFNSETQNLSYVFPTNPFFYRSAELSGLLATFNITNDRATSSYLEGREKLTRFTMSRHSTE